MDYSESDVENVSRVTTVTVTGADDNTAIIGPVNSIAAVHRDHSNIEWGILFGSSDKPRPRYPSTKWVKELVEEAAKDSKVQLSAHLCGKRVDEAITTGIVPIFQGDLQDASRYFHRVQLNLGKRLQSVLEDASSKVWNLRMPNFGYFELILGGCVKRITPDILERLRKRKAHILYDNSGGRGIAGTEWPVPSVILNSGQSVPAVTWGYAGGLGPETLPIELPKMDAAIRDSLPADGIYLEGFWVAMESSLRDIDNNFDLSRCRRAVKAVNAFNSK